MALAREFTHHLSRSPRGERADPRGRVLERAVGRARGVGRAADRASAPGSTSATRCGSTSSAASSAPRVTSIRDVEWRESRNGGFVFVFRPGRARPGAADVRRRRSRGRRAPRRAPASSTIWSQQFPNVSVIDFREILETIRDVMSKVTLAITVVGGLVLFSGGADPDRRRRDDQVPARLRGGGLQDARREHPHHRPDAAVRVRRARVARRD